MLGTASCGKTKDQKEWLICQPTPTLKHLPHYLAFVCEERGWTKASPLEKFVLFMEQSGELAKAMRKAAGLYEERAKQHKTSLAEESADVLSYLVDLANCFQVDLEFVL